VSARSHQYRARSPGETTAGLRRPSVAQRDSVRRERPSALATSPVLSSRSASGMAITLGGLGGPHYLSDPAGPSVLSGLGLRCHQNGGGPQPVREHQPRALIPTLRKRDETHA
jgi:hypothetical protein